MNRWRLALCHSALIAALGLSLASATTLQGTVGPDLPPAPRLGVFLIGPDGQAQAEWASSAISGGHFSLDLPDSAPPNAQQYALRRDSIAWPGVFDPVNIAREVQAAELRAYVYSDSSANGHYDAGESMFEAPLHAGRDALVLVWVSQATSVQAARGFSASLHAGWNALDITPGKTVKVSAFGGASLNLQLAR